MSKCVLETTITSSSLGQREALSAAQAGMAVAATQAGKRKRTIKRTSAGRGTIQAMMISLE